MMETLLLLPMLVGGGSRRVVSFPLLLSAQQQ